ncbi:uncharacterized protein [Pempheris klunzingeri]|uniref:uncharacterized protein n=1 Tax=Pempheris klunzingeri TaxID=3127111 RepID=UPI00397E9A0C
MSSDTGQNEAQKERDWKEIAVALGLPVEEVKVRAASLRTQYSKLLKPLRSGRSNKAVTPGQKRILSSLKFLEKHVASRPTEAHLDQSAEGMLTVQQDSDDAKPKNATFQLDLDSGRSRSPADGGGVFRAAWPVEKEDVFFELWRQHECLYNVGAKKFCSQLEKEKKWAEIAAVLEIPVEAVKMRASSLRTQYSKLVKPGKRKTPLTARQRKILMSCDFLKKYICHRPTKGGLDRSMTDAVETQQDSSDSEPENTELSSRDSTPSPTESPSVSPPAEKQPRNQSRNDGERQKAALLQHMLDIIQEPSRQPERDCEDSFGVTVAMELKRLRSPVLRNRVKRQIMTILYDALDSEQITVS